MAVKFANTINQSLVFSLFKRSSFSIGFFSGTQPTANYLISNYSSGDNIRNNYLGGIINETFSNAWLTQNDATGLISDSSSVVLAGGTVRTFTATATGVCGGWAMVGVFTNVNFTNITNSALATAYRFWIVPVTDSLTPGGIIRLDTLSFTSGSTITITDFTFVSSAGEA